MNEKMKNEINKTINELYIYKNKIIIIIKGYQT
jgi:hypothetical protein